MNQFLSLLRPHRRATPDAALAAAVLFSLVLIVVPVPTWALDVLLASNLTLSAVLLLYSVFVASPLQISGFPTLLLLTTLLRLSLNISSTRLILSQADAGRVIQSFGAYVVRGNYIVGAVVFLLLLVVQFVVVAKGAERIAEVGARFALDAMPAKQLGLDAQQRLGALSADQARRARLQLEREGQFYGAMDGAMKFVKGDVIAGAIITIVNIVGGISIGVFQREMPLPDALNLYGLLTVGDGFVSQLPALVTATAAGVLVTRVASEGATSALGEQLADQLLASPEAIRVGAYFAAVLAIVPGLPAIPFALAAVVMGGLAVVSTRRRARQSELVVERQDQDRVAFVPELRRWELRLGGGLSGWIAEQWSGEILKSPGLLRVTERIRGQFFDRLGIPLPRCHVRTDKALPELDVQLLILEIPVLQMSAPAEGRSEWLLQWVPPALQRHARDLLGLGETLQLLDQLRSSSPAIVSETIPTLLTTSQLAKVLQFLVDEGVSIRDLTAIMEALQLNAKQCADPMLLAERVRETLQRALGFQLLAGRDELPVLTLAPELEDSVRDAVVTTAAGVRLALPLALRHDIVAAVQHACATLGHRTLVALVPQDLRPHVRQLLRPALPELRIISANQLPPETAVQQVAVAKLPSHSLR